MPNEEKLKKYDQRESQYNNRDQNKISQLLLYESLGILIVILTIVWIPCGVYKYFQKQSEQGDSQVTNNTLFNLKGDSQVTNNTLFNLIWIPYINKSYSDNFLKKLVLQAFKFAEAHANKGNPKAQYEVGRMYETGKRGDGANLDEAQIWYNKASEQGYAEAQFALARIYDQKNKKDANDWYKKALKGFLTFAEKGDIDASIYLWYMYENGLGVQKDLTESFYWLSKIFEYWESFYKSDCQSAQFYLDTIIPTIDNSSSPDIQLTADHCHLRGDVYYYGRGINRNFQEAKYWYEKAAEKGDVKAQFRLVYMINNGLGGTEKQKDIESLSQKVFKELDKLSEEGDIEILIYLSYMIKNKLVVGKDESIAKNYEERAFRKNSRETSNLIDELDNPPKQNFSNEPKNNLSKIRYMHLNLDENALNLLKNYEFILAQKYANQDYTKAQCDLSYMDKERLRVTKNDSNKSKSKECLSRSEKKYNRKMPIYLGYLTLYASENSDKKDYQKDYQDASKYFEKLAEKGDMEANLYLAYMYDKKLGVEKNENQSNKFFENAVNLFEQVAIQNYEYAQNNLEKSKLEKDNNKNNKEDTIYNFCLYLIKIGDMYKNRRGETNIDVSKYWYQQAHNCLEFSVRNYKNLSEQLSGKFLFQLEMMYKNGNVVEKDDCNAKNLLKDVKSYFENFANKKDADADAQCTLGDIYYIEKDYKKAQEWYEKSANKGNADAQYKLAEMYREGVGLEKNLEEARKWYNISANNNKGNADAQYKLGDLSIDDFKNELIKKSESQKKFDHEEDKTAEFYLSLLEIVIKKDKLDNLLHYFNGQNNKKIQSDWSENKNLKQARYWYQQSAKKGNEKAQLRLGDIYYIEKNYEKAKEYYEKSAKKGNADAQLMLGEIYYHGFGVKENHDEAWYWYEKSYNQNNDIAGNRMNRMKSNGYFTTRKR